MSHHSYYMVIRAIHDSPLSTTCQTIFYLSKNVLHIVGPEKKICVCVCTGVY